MPGFDFDAAVKDAEKSGMLQGGDRFKLKEGANKVRLLSEPLPYQHTYKGQKRFQWLVYILDRADGQVKLFFCPHTIFRQVGDLQKSDDYRFFDMPMPYDVTIQAKGAGTKEVEYSVIPSPRQTPVTKEELEAFGVKKPLRDVRDALLAKEQTEAPPQNGERPFDPDEIPV